MAQGAETDAIKATTAIKTAVQEEVKDAIATGVEKEIMKTHNQLVKITVQAAQLPEKVKEEIERVITNADKVNTFKEVSQKLLEDIETTLLEAAKSITENTKELFEPNHTKKQAESVIKQAMSPRLHTISLITTKDKSFTRKPVFGKFRIQKWNFTLINFHLKSNNTNKPNADEVQAIHKVFESFPNAGEDIILLGDFNDDIDCDHNRTLKVRRYKNIFLHEKTNYKRDKSFDAIIVQGDRHKFGVSDAGVATTYASDAHPVSNHYPIYADFKILGK